MKRFKLLLFVLLMLLLWLPLIQQWTGMFKETKLNGAFVIPKNPEFSIDSLETLQYQKNLEDYLNNTFGFRPVFVKIKNSWEYLLFRQINVGDQVLGKNGYIYSQTSIEKMLGGWYNGSIRNDQTISKINFLKEGIEQHGGHFLAIFAPSKESVLPEFLPEKYAGMKADSSDYNDFIRGYEKYKIPYIDFAAYFKKIKSTTEHPLFTTTGFHWSSYAAEIAQDSILSYMQHVITDPMPAYKLLDVEWSDTVRDSEADFEEPMNLLFSLNQPKYVYPKMEMIPSTVKNKRPKVIIVGDSFFWQIKNLKTLQHIFSEDSQYWYYFARHSFPLGDVPGVLMSDLNIMEELQTADFVILVGSFGTTSEFPFGVTDYYRDHLSDVGTLTNIEEYIRNTPVWTEKLKEASKNSQKTQQELIYSTAKEICRNKETFNLKASNGKFVCADAGIGDLVTADKSEASDWERFSLFQLDGNNVIISSFKNKFFCSEMEKDGEIVANRDKVGSWEIFSKTDLGNNRVAFRASNGKYLSFDEKTKQLFARSVSIGEKETFIFIKK